MASMEGPSIISIRGASILVITLSGTGKILALGRRRIALDQLVESLHPPGVKDQPCQSSLCPVISSTMPVMSRRLPTAATAKPRGVFGDWDGTLVAYEEYGQSSFNQHQQILSLPNLWLSRGTQYVTLQVI
jgi:hypothetical protein